MSKFSPLQIFFYEANQWRPVICLVLGMLIMYYFCRKHNINNKN